MSTSPLDRPLASWTADDVQRLIDGAVEEGQRVEYKELLDLRSRSDRLEALKDLTGPANAVGGWVIFGVPEKKLSDGRVVPGPITPLRDASIQDRLADIAAAGVSPPLNVEMRRIDAPEGFVLVCHVAARSGAPHMIQAYGENCYYRRYGRSTRPIPPDELERMFAELANRERSIVDRLREVPIISRLEGLPGNLVETYPREASPEPRAMWISLIAVPIDAPPVVLKITHDVLESLSQLGGRYLDIGSLFTPDVHGVTADYVEHTRLRLRYRVYRSGIIEIGQGENPGSDGLLIESGWLVRYADNFVRFAGAAYRAIDYAGRVRLYLAFDDGASARLGRGGGLPRHHEPILNADPASSFSDTTVDAMLGESESVIRPLMDWLWTCFGLDRCRLYQDDGTLSEATKLQLHLAGA